MYVEQQLIKGAVRPLIKQLHLHIHVGMESWVKFRNVSAASWMNLITNALLNTWSRWGLLLRCKKCYLSFNYDI